VYPEKLGFTNGDQVKIVNLAKCNWGKRYKSLWFWYCRKIGNYIFA